MQCISLLCFYAHLFSSWGKTKVKKHRNHSWKLTQKYQILKGQRSHIIGSCFCLLLCQLYFSGHTNNQGRHMFYMRILLEASECPQSIPLWWGSHMQLEVSVFSIFIPSDLSSLSLPELPVWVLYTHNTKQNRWYAHPLHNSHKNSQSQLTPYPTGRRINQAVASLEKNKPQAAGGRGMGASQTSSNVWTHSTWENNFAQG